jgi:CheY-like chemotaxis protein
MADPFDGAPGADATGSALLAAAWDALEPAFVVREGPGPGFHLVLANRAWIEAIGLPRAEIRGRPLAELLPAGPAGDLEARCRAAVASKGPLRFAWAFPPGQGAAEIQGVLTPLFDGAGACSGVLGVARAAPGLAREGEQLKLADRMSSVGTLAAGVAHEIDTPLGSVIGNLRFLLEGLSKLAGLAADRGVDVAALNAALREIRDGANRVRDIVNDLKTFSRAELERRGPASAAASPSPQVPRDLHARILIIDDEPLVGASIRRVLSGEHEVFAVTQGAEALRRIAAGERFDALLCDLMMPEMTGMDLHAELSRSCPDQAGRMGFLTGGTYTRRATAFVERMADRTLAKPFSTEALRGFVRKLSQH